MAPSDSPNPSDSVHPGQSPPASQSTFDTNSPPPSFDPSNISQEDSSRYNNARPPSLLWAAMFTVVISNLAYVAAADYSYRDTRRVAAGVKAGEFSIFGSLLSFVGADDPIGIDEQHLRAAKRHEIAQLWGLRMQWLEGWCDQLALPKSVKEFVMTMSLMCAERYIELTESRRVLVPIVAANSTIFLLWVVAGRSGRLYRFLNAHFVHTPAGPSSRTHGLLTSVFSHQSLPHFAFNTIALWSFAGFGGGALLAPAFLANAKESGGTGSASRTPEASLAWHFLAFYLVAGVGASLVSHLGAAIRWRLIARRYGTELAKRTVGMQGGLGSSGAVYAIVVMSALSFPDARVAVIFLPFFSLPIAQGVLALIAIDIVGAIRGWTVFDHLAHLGGAAFGALYWRYGAEIWEQTKHFVDAEEKDQAVRERDSLQRQRGASNTRI